VAGGLLLGAVWLIVLRSMPDISVSPQGSVVRSAILRDIAALAAAVMLALAVFGLVGGWFLAGRMLRPLESISQATRLVASGRLSHRIALPGRRDEFGDLADSFDAMVARLEAHDAELQRFAANASHELRTPLAVSRALLEVAARDPERDAAKLVQRLSAVNDRAIALTEALLLLSRAEQGAFEREPVDLSLIAEEAVETLAPLAEKHGVEVEARTDAPAVALGSPALIAQMAANLLHNAIVHNLAAGGTASIATSAGGTWAVLEVENTGEALDKAVTARLTEPFQRGSDRVHTDQAGAGLGLAITKSVIQAHGGQLALNPRPGGGLSAQARLPAAPRGSW
jgi:two-component system sensor histidine kinase VanS